MLGDLILMQNLRADFDRKEIATARFHLPSMAGALRLIGDSEWREVDFVAAAGFAIVALKQQREIGRGVLVLRDRHGLLMHVAEHGGARCFKAATYSAKKSNAGFRLFGHGMAVL